MRSAARQGDDYGVTAQPSWREVNWREHLRSLDIDGGSVNYVDMGPGSGSADAPPVLFIHGLGGCWQNWLENIPRVAQERRVLAPDLPGFGSSELPLDRISIPGYGRFVEKFCERLGLDQVVVVGNSMGGFVGAELAIQRPRGWSGSFGVRGRPVDHEHPPAPPPDLGPRRRGARRLRRGAPAARDRPSTAAARRARLRGASSHAPSCRPRLGDHVRRRPARFPRRAERAGSTTTSTTASARSARPTFIVWARTTCSCRSRTHRVRAADPELRKVIFEDTGHVPMLERPETFTHC